MNKNNNLDDDMDNNQNISSLSAIFDKNEVSGQASHLISNLGYALKKFRYLIVFFIISFTIFGWYNTAKKPILYRSSLTLINEPDFNSRATGNESARYLMYLTSHYYQTQFDILNSKKLATKVAAEIIEKELNVPKEATTHLKQSPLYEIITSIREKIRSLVNTISSSVRGSEINPGTEEILVLDNNDPNAILNSQYANLVIRGLSVSGGRTSRLLRLNFVSTDRVFAAEVLNLIAQVYQDYIIESKQAISTLTSNWLVKQLDNAKDELINSEKKLVDFQKDVQLSNIETLRSRDSGNLQTQVTLYNSAKAEYVELLARYGSKHPEVSKMYSELKSLERSLTSLEGDKLDKQDVVFELIKLEKEVEANQGLYISYLSRLKGFNISDEQTVSTVSVLDKAEIPGGPFSPNIKNGILTWGLFGVLFGITLALLLSFMDRTYKTIEDIEHKLNLPVLGQIPFLSNKILSALVLGKKQIADPEMYYSANTKSIFSEAINHIRTNLLFSSIDRHPQTILITSSIQAEGKTTVATNLAFSLSKIDKTILIDADLRKPRIANVFQSDMDDQSPKGLVDYLAGLASFEESTYEHSTFENLTIFPSGTLPPNPQELLASVKFNQFLEDLKTKYKYIVIDTAPVLPVSDSIVLGKVVDVLLVAVKAGSTTIKMTRETIKRLNIARVYPTGLVLTQLDKPNKAYGKSGLNYYYSYYGKDVKKPN